MTGIDRVFLLTRETSRQPDQECAVIRGSAGAGSATWSNCRSSGPTKLAAADRSSAPPDRASAEQSGLAYTILRPVFFMQNLFRMLRHGAIATATRDGRLAMIDARDIAAPP